MKRHRFVRGLKFVLFALLFVVVLGFVVMSLWNWLTPALFGWHVISFWQAVGILILSKILLGGFRGRPGYHMYWRRRMMERWEQMTPEEREKFRASMRGRCGPFGPPAAEPKA
jgi:predicted membrane chloride channel (bestrophin family)